MSSAADNLVHPNLDSNDELQIDLETKKAHNDSSGNEFTPTYGNLLESDTITPILLEWSNVRYTIVKKSKQEVKKIPILNGVSGYANPGEMIVLMGSSGAGKTTLLNLLCNRISSVGEIEFEGNISANGLDIKKINFSDHIGYVTQEDLMMPTMTCRETLEFVANLKIQGTQEYIKKVVNQMIEHLKISKAADTIIGSQFIKGVSGGERKRVAIGVELITDPSVLFLDEPTSGLDSFTADLILDLLRKEGKKGRTVITTLHQPSDNMFRNFQRLILMFEGNIIYQGPAKKSRNYFGALGYQTPARINPPDYYMEILHIKSRENKTSEEEDRLKFFCDAYDQNKGLYNFPKSNLQVDHSDLPALDTLKGRSKSSWFNQFKCNLIRNFRHAAREPLIYKVTFFQGLWLILMLDLIWNDLDTSYQGVQSRSGFLFFCMLQQLFQCVISTALTCNFYSVPSEKNIYFKEESSGLYSLSPYFISKQLSTLPIHTVVPIMISLGLYWAVDLENEAGKFFTFGNSYIAFVMILCSFTGGSYGLLAGVIFPSQLESAPASQILIVPWMLYAGLFSTTDSLPLSFGWLKYISPQYYAWHALMGNEFADKDLDCNECEDKDLDCNPCDPLDAYGINEDNVWRNIGLLIVIGVGLRFVSGFILYYKTIKSKRH